MSHTSLVSPCNRIPTSDDKTFGYLPILAGLFEDDFGDFSEAIDWLLVSNFDNSSEFG